MIYFNLSNYILYSILWIITLSIILLLHIDVWIKVSLNVKTLIEIHDTPTLKNQTVVLWLWVNLSAFPTTTDQYIHINENILDQF